MVWDMVWIIKNNNQSYIANMEPWSYSEWKIQEIGYCHFLDFWIDQYAFGKINKNP